MPHVSFDAQPPAGRLVFKFFDNPLYAVLIVLEMMLILNGCDDSMLEGILPDLIVVIRVVDSRRARGVDNSVFGSDKRLKILVR